MKKIICLIAALMLFLSSGCVRGKKNGRKKLPEKFETGNIKKNPRSHWLRGFCYLTTVTAPGAEMLTSVSPFAFFDASMLIMPYGVGYVPLM